ncbi:MAG: AraC family transcriptional regulator [Acutalibacteraceae bacterium]|nr:AraC family transcriptional regulator [Acutalibacteraceae bacterium]
MFFEKETLSFNILDVIEIKQNNINTFNSERNFCALSFRFKSDAILKTKTKEYFLSDNTVSYIASRINYSREASVDDMIVIHFDSIDYHTKQIEHFIPQNADAISELFSKILECWNKKDCGYKYKCSAILYEIFAECYIQNYISQPNNSKIQNSVDYILENYKNANLSIKEISQKSFMSEVYFRKLFKKEYGVSPQKYIINLRIQHAIGLISTGYYQLKEIAVLSGYNDYKYFSTEFKKIIGVSPSEYLYNYKE